MCGEDMKYDLKEIIKEIDENLIIPWSLRKGVANYGVKINGFTEVEYEMADAIYKYYNKLGVPMGWMRNGFDSDKEIIFYLSEKDEVVL